MIVLIQNKEIELTIPKKDIRAMINLILEYQRLLADDNIDAQTLKAYRKAKPAYIKLSNLIGLNFPEGIGVDSTS